MCEGGKYLILALPHVTSFIVLGGVKIDLNNTSKRKAKGTSFTEIPWERP